MAKVIRLKKVDVCVSDCGPRGGSDCTQYCSEQDVPIRDWGVSTPNIKLKWTRGSEYPESQSITAVFPELNFLYPQYKKFAYKIKKTAEQDFLLPYSKKIAEQDGSVLATDTITFNFQNLGQLAVGRHEAFILLEAYGIDDAGERHLLEDSSIQEVSFSILIEVAEGQILSVDKEKIKVLYNISGDRFRGDSVLVDTTESIITEEFRPASFNDFPPIFTTKSIENGKMKISFIKGFVGHHYLPKVYYFDYYIATATSSVIIPVEMEVIRQTEMFDVNPKDFSATLTKPRNTQDRGESKDFSAEIINPDNLTIAVEVKPQFVETCSIEGNMLKFTTKRTGELLAGSYTGEIVLKSGETRKRLSVSILVNYASVEIKEVEHSFNQGDVFFALDKNLVKIKQPEGKKASFLRVTLSITFGQNPIEQTYSVPFFREIASFDIGAEVNDFFPHYAEFQNVLADYPYAKVNATFSVMNAQNEEIANHKILGIKFLPGQKPKLFPILSDFPKRRIFAGTGFWFFVAKETQAEALLIDNINNIPTDLAIKREDFLTFPNKKSSIVIYWENQNLVFDWLFCPHNFQIKEEIEHITGESRFWREEKFGATCNQTLVVNTGWLRREEIPMISALLKSRKCFIKIDDEIYQVFPSGKKNELTNSEEHRFQMDLEFKILNNDR